MSRIKYSIFVFLVLIAFTSFGSSLNESENYLQKNKVEKIIAQADLKAEYNDHFQAVITLESAIGIY